MWAWIAAFAAASLAAAGPEESRSGSLVAFVAIASGAAGCVVAGLWADRWGKARIARLALHHQRRLFGRRRAALRHAARGVTGACGDLGLFRRCRLRAVLRAGQRIQRAHARRHRADTPNLRRLPADNGEHETAAARSGQLWMAVGVPAARARPDPRRARNEPPSPVSTSRARQRREHVRTSHIARERRAISPAPTESPAWRSSCNWRSKAAPPAVPPPSAGRGLRANSAHRQ